MGAAVVTIQGYSVTGNKRMHWGTLHLSTSYATGGDTWTPNNFGMSTVEQLDINSPGTLIMLPDTVNLKIKAYYPTGGGGPNPTTPAAPKVSSGGSTASAVDATDPTITPGVGIEVAATADLSGTVVSFQAIGV